MGIFPKKILIRYLAELRKFSERNEPWPFEFKKHNGQFRVSQISNFFDSFVWKKSFLHRSQIRWNFWNRSRNEVKRKKKKIRSKKPFFGNSGRLSILSKRNFDCVRMNFYVKLLGTCYEKFRKSKVPKMVIFGRKPKLFSLLHFSTDFKNFNGSET